MMIPFFATMNQFVGILASFFVVVGLWFTNAYYTGYLPINGNRVYDNTGNPYNVSRAVDEHGLYDAATYAAYSPAYLTAGNLTVYIFFFAVYSSTITYIALYHRIEVFKGFENVVHAFRRKNGARAAEYQDVHNKLMTNYPEGKLLWLSPSPMTNLLPSWKLLNLDFDSSTMVVYIGPRNGHRLWNWWHCGLADIYHTCGCFLRLAPCSYFRDTCRHCQGHDWNRGDTQCSCRIYRG